MDGDTSATITSPHSRYPIAQLEPLGYTQANAQLIAAAPDLAAALSGLVKLINSPFPTSEAEARVVFEAANAALAKAGYNA